ncbi:MAG: KUP/HAK/KT family potassium transporter, partial [Reyranella sp.]|nr:KUP/HAK/KT family potassium transporter [Reyranella sp.]
MAPAETSQTQTSTGGDPGKPAVHPAGAALIVGALGVVFGDIGTSPLYALRESFQHGLTPTPEHVLGVLSILFWAVTLT